MDVTSGEAPTGVSVAEELGAAAGDGGGGGVDGWFSGVTRAGAECTGSSVSSSAEVGVGEGDRDLAGDSHNGKACSTNVTCRDV